MARDSVAEVREQTDIVDLVGSYVQLKRTGSSFKGLCPFHQEKSPSFVVFPQSGTFNCFGCGKGGDALTFYQEIEHVDFREALHELARRAGITLSTAPVRDPAEQDKRQRLVDANAAAARFFQRAIGLEVGARGRELAHRRGLDDATMQTFRIGFAPDSWDSLLRNLEALGFPPDLALEAGLLIRNEAGRTYDRFRGRLIFPISDRDGDIVGFGGRALGDEQPKYLNSPQTPLFDKSGLLYGLHLAKDAIRERGEVVVVEGYMDVVTAHQFGHRNVVAAMGTALTEAQINLVKRYAPRIVLALDADAAGQAAMVRGLETATGAIEHDDVVIAVAPGMISTQQRLKTEIRIATMPVGKDPDELIRRSPESWEAAIAGARPVIDWLIDAFAETVHLDDANSKSSAVQRMLPILRQLPDRVLLHHYAAVVARKLGTVPEAVLSELSRGGSGNGRPRRGAGVPGNQGDRFSGGADDRRNGEQQRPSLPPGSRFGAAPVPSRRRRDLDNESYLIALFVAFRPYLEPVLEQLPDDLVYNGRNRELVRMLRSAESAGLFGERLIIALPDELADYAELLNAAVGGDEEARPETDLEREENRSGRAPRMIPKRYPAEVRTEALETLRQLQRERFNALLNHLQEEIRAAQSSGDIHAMAEVQQRMSDLSQTMHHFDPPPSPVFRDSRSPAGP
jgi:DNA primase